jgi:hypothetical protein
VAQGFEDSDDSESENFLNQVIEKKLQAMKMKHKAASEAEITRL